MRGVSLKIPVMDCNKCSTSVCDKRLLPIYQNSRNELLDDDNLYNNNNNNNDKSVSYCESTNTMLDSILNSVEGALNKAIDFSSNSSENRAQGLNKDLVNFEASSSRDRAPDHIYSRELSPQRLSPPIRSFTQYNRNTAGLSRIDTEISDSEVKRSRNTSSTSDSARRSTRKPKRNPFLPKRDTFKRSTMQSMTRPLKHWLFKNRHNPYPTKTEKLRLADGSNMTMVQVSNWFANARRRLKHTVKNNGVSWEDRVRLYNHYIEGNAERLSEISDESVFSDLDDDMQPACKVSSPDDEEQKPSVSTYSDGLANHSEQRIDSHSVHSADNSQLTFPQNESTSNFSAPSPARVVREYMTCHKYKQTILQRYLNDAYSHSMATASETVRRRNNSGSMCSQVSEDSVDTRASPMVTDEFVHEKPIQEEIDITQTYGFSELEQKDLHWKEISAALALTNLAKARDYSVF